MKRQVWLLTRWRICQGIPIAKELTKLSLPTAWTREYIAGIVKAREEAEGKCGKLVVLGVLDIQPEENGNE
jgi:hypothetical protein